jgi:hypothetical protein
LVKKHLADRQLNNKVFVWHYYDPGFWSKNIFPTDIRPMQLLLAFVMTLEFGRKIFG